MKNIKINKIITLPTQGTWPATQHIFEKQSIEAITAAYYAGRPLLIRGETGAGKSQLARAIAYEWKRLFVSEVVNSRTESSDLHYQFDAVARLADAQAASAFVKKSEDVKKYLNPKKYLTPSALWWVFNWGSAEEICNLEGSNCKPLQKPVFKDEKGETFSWQPKDGAVILIDEIDKAETDLPNDLLETLGNGGFTVPWLDQPITMDKQKAPLIIITTNDERELPAAFVRRCVVLNLNPPEQDKALVKWLCQRGKVHYQQQCSEVTLQKAAELLVKNRSETKRMGVPPIGQAEYLDLLRILCGQTQDEGDMERRDEKHRQLIETMSQYVYKKYPEKVS